MLSVARVALSQRRRSTWPCKTAHLYTPHATTCSST